MNNQNKDGSLEALVAADTGGNSGRPVGAQAPVAGGKLLVDGEENLTSDEEHDQEIRRWQDEIRDLLIRLTGAPENKVDGRGCESGDPLDFTLAEISMAINWLKDQQELSGGNDQAEP